ncbi:hypothetical protein EB796_000823 [Bugula neritina]|uniref:Uncharacterized protein n=1 Tax=Bugula neritina TaxID=10212 RepID=A0A7J7KRS2_BUGNE|nr:hypothetical protein EB796_000823 [Bugula neritina]
MFLISPVSLTMSFSSTSCLVCVKVAADGFSLVADDMLNSVVVVRNNTISIKVTTPNSTYTVFNYIESFPHMNKY